MKRVCLLSLLSLFIFLSACKKNPENLVSYVKNFSDEVSLQQNLIFTFNHEMIDESAIGKWDSTQYIRFKPEIKGRFRWSSTRELVFSPATSYDASRDYKAEFSDRVFQNAKEKDLYYGDEYKSIKFHTPYLVPQSVNAFWARGKDGTGVVIRLGLNFNYAVKPEQLTDLVKVYIGDENAGFTIDNTAAGPNVFVTVNGSPFGREESLVKVKFGKGLKMAVGDYTTSEEYEFSQVLASRFDMKILDVITGYNENEAFVKITTSQELESADIEKTYTITPEVTAKAELTENGMVLKGNFQVGQGYKLVLHKTLKGILGGVMKEDSEHDLYFGEMRPSISFANKKAIYLSSAGSKNIGINIVNVPEVKLKVIKVYENNIMAYLHRNDYGYYYDYYDDYDSDYSPSYDDDDQGHYSDVVIEREVKTADLPKVNGMSVLTLDMPRHEKFKGIYMVKVSSKTDYYLRTTKLVSVSDIGLIAKQADDDILVSANSILTAHPLSNVDLHFISTNNQDVFQAKTDSKGLVLVKGLKDKLKQFKIAMITAHQGDDFNYLMYSGTQVEISRFDVEGKREHPSGLDAFIYGDRNIYRPGETVYFNTVIRKKNWAVAADMPVKVKILLPNGKEYKSIRKNTDKQGAVDGSFEIAQNTVTGSYVIEVYNGNDVLLNSRYISIEEFMPDRLKVDVRLGKESYNIGEKIKVTFEAQNFFGPPAANRNYESELSYSLKDFNPKGYEDYGFYISNSGNQSFSSDLRQGITDDLGIGQQEYDIPPDYRDMGILEGRVYVTVFDESGRPVHRVKRFDVVTQPVMYGIYMEDYYINTQQNTPVKLVALNKDGKPVAGSRALVELVRFEWQSVLQHSGDYYSYASKRLEKVVSSRVVDFGNGETVYNIHPNVSGEYAIRVRREGANRYTSYEFYAYGWGNTESSSFEVNTEGTVDVVFDKEKYNVGDNAKVLFKAPFTGKMLVTIERNGIMEYRYLETDKKSAEMTLNIKDEYLPNIYISATLIKELQNSAIPLTVAHGYGSMKIEKPSTILPVTITAVEKSRSSTKQKITVKTKAESGIQVTLAVVDEGVLAVKNFETPDPHGYFYASRALEVASYDLYPYLFPELSHRRSSSGGDGYDLAKRVNPLSNNRVKLIAKWSGILNTNSNGEVSYEVDIPKFSGDLRIMAVAYKNNAFGSSAKNMKVADPLVVTTSLPRFLSPGDEIDLPLNVSNTTEKQANSTATVSVSGPVEIVGSTSSAINIAGNKESRTLFKLRAKQEIGNAKVSVTVKGLGEKFLDETEITVRPSTSLLKKFEGGAIKAGDSKEIALSGDFIPSSADSRLVVSKNPMSQFIDQFSYLLGYPHGCVEQTVSKAFPQLYFAEFVKGMKKGKRPMGISVEDENELNPNFNVQEAIRKLQGMQLYNGSLSYWPGYGYESWWGSVYAAHFLLEAEKAGFDIDNTMFDKLLDYITYKSNTKANEVYAFYQNSTLSYRDIASREIIYSLYVLSLANKPNRPVMNYYKSNLNMLSIDEKYMLAGAFANISDRASYSQVLPKGYLDENSIKATGGSFYSPMRNLAISLNTLVESDFNNPQVAVMAKNLSEQLRGARYYSTQEVAFAFLALGKIAKKANKSIVSALVKVNGKTVGNFANDDLVLDNKKLNGQSVTITTSGSGTVYYFYQSEGISSSGKYEEVDNYLRLRKTFLDRFGKPISGNTFKQNDLIIVRIGITATDNMHIENVVVTDMLPAGFEIENPRLTEGQDFQWTTNRVYPDYFDIRDDRINYYLDAPTSEKYLYYMVRAVSKGTFKMGPVSADAMYNGEYRSYNGAGTIVVQ